MSKKVIRVHFVDKSCKAFGVDGNTTTIELRQMVIDKVGLREDACFALFEKKDEWERCLEPDEKPTELLLQWEKEKGEKRKGDQEPVLLFKKKIFLKDDDREMQDLVAKDLIYLQALNSIVTSEYPCGAEDAVKLAGLEFQILHQDHNPAFHVPGYLLPTIENFVPRSLFPSKRPQDWEALILREHESLVGRNPEDAKSEYLSIVKEWGYYGTTFFPPCRSAGNRNLPNKVIIGVNYEGIQLLKPKNKQRISEHLFTEICSWASSSGTFAFEFGNQNESQKYTFETRMGPIIASTIQTYIDILVQILKNGDDDDEDDDESETGTTISQCSE